MGRLRKSVRIVYGKIKKYQYITNKYLDSVHDEMLDDIYISGRSSRVNKKRRTRIGHVEKSKGELS
jgi:hypothetical protein